MALSMTTRSAALGHASAGRPSHALRPARRSTVAVQAMARGLPKRWEDVNVYLTQEKKLQSVTPEDAQQLAQSGKYVLVDVRLPDQFAKSRAEGSVSVPMYQPLDWSKPDAVKVFKFVAYSFNGVQAVEPNPNFFEQIKEIAATGKGIITVCEAGGTLKGTVNFPAGKSSRSLQAAYRLYSEGVTDKVAHLDRGLYGWFQSDLPFEGEGEYKPDIGRTPMAAADPTMAVLQQSRGYELRESDKRTK